MTTIDQLCEIFEDARLRQQAEREVRLMDEYMERMEAHIRDFASHGAHSLFKERFENIHTTLRVSMQYYVTECRLVDDLLFLLAVDPVEIAAICCEEIKAIARRKETGGFEYTIAQQTLARRIGVLVEQFARHNVYKAVRSGRFPKDPLKALPLIELANEVGISARTLRKWKNEDVLLKFFEAADEDRSIAIGSAILDLIYQDVEDLIIRYESRESTSKSQNKWTVRSDVIEQMHQEFALSCDAKTPLGFMVCKPNPLVAGDLALRSRYLTEGRQLWKELVRPSETALLSANMTQDVAYTINQDALTALEALTEEQLNSMLKIAEVPTEAREEESDRQFKARRLSVIDSNDAKKRQIPNLIKAAKEATQYPAVYFPVYFDFRGRQYSVDYLGLGPQGSKSGKALLQFAEGRALGANGLWCLYHELGNAMGFDKDLLDVKVEKARNLDTTNPTWFLEADEPLKACAIQADIEKALQSGDPASYVSHQIVYVDGSCNGIQHLSLLARDTKGASATNVVGDLSTRNDLYMAVAQKFMDILEDDHSESGMYWKQFTLEEMRQRVKRGVMTLPYGVTENGVADQVIKDDFCSTKDVTDPRTKEQATKFKEVLFEAVAGAAPKAMEIRAWLMKAVELMCKGDTAPTWVSPCGTDVFNTYRKPSMRKLRRFGLDTRVPTYSPSTGDFDIAANKRGIVANLIHSFDASMLQQTAVQVAEKGVNALSFVHDSYGCPAGDMDSMNETLRDVAVEMYRESPLEALKSEWEQRSGLELPVLPAAGDLDVEQVKTSPYFFA